MDISPALAEPLSSADVVVWIVRLRRWLLFWLLGGEPYHQLHLMFLTASGRNSKAGRSYPLNIHDFLECYK